MKKHDYKTGWWSRRDIQTVRDLYPTTKNAEIAKIVRRPIGAVAQLASRKGWKKPEGYLSRVKRKPRRKPSKDLRSVRPRSWWDVGIFMDTR